MKRKVNVIYSVCKELDCEVEVPNNPADEDAYFDDFQTIHDAIRKIEDPSGQNEVEWEILSVFDNEAKECYFEV